MLNVLIYTTTYYCQNDEKNENFYFTFGLFMFCKALFDSFWKRHLPIVPKV
jgi:hypothetical protein